jgi:membrane protein YqaA with SNARE-associated domain
MDYVQAWLQELALNAGGLGLFIASFLDSSFLFLPELNDFLVLWMVIQHKHLLVYYVAMATCGSLAGCLTLYYLADKSGERMLRRKYSTEKIERVSSWFRRYGSMAILIPALSPPPVPFKLFVLLAGVAKMPVGKFIAAIIVGRGIRFSTTGLLAIYYGDQAVRFGREYGEILLVLITGILLVSCVVYLFVRRRSRAL